MSGIDVTKDNFEEEVLKSDKPVLVDFWATWCGPCQALSPVISEIADEYKNRIKVCKVDVDKETELTSAFKVFSIPTLLVIKDGQVTNFTVGVQPKERIISMF